MQIITREEIDAVLPSLDLVPRIEEAFVAYSAGKAVVPPVGELRLEGGDVHIKYGYIQGEEHYVIKVASGFHGNAALGLPPGNGLMLLFHQRTGELASVLLDEGHLTDVRTAAAGAIAAKHLAPSTVRRIGIIGTGIQARLQLAHLLPVTKCREVLVWGRGPEQVARYVGDMEARGFRVTGAADLAEVPATCDLIVTTTPSTMPLVRADDLRPGTHITAMGSDTADKQELEAACLARADVVVADSIEQCRVRGEIHFALAAGVLPETQLSELGDVIAGRAPGRTSEDEITVADLTGVAVQDIAISSAVHAALTGA